MDKLTADFTPSCVKSAVFSYAYFQKTQKCTGKISSNIPAMGVKTEGYPAWRMGLAPQLVFVFIAACKSTSPRFIWLYSSEIYLKLPSLDSTGLFFGKGQIFLEIFTVCYAIFISHEHPLTVF